MNSLTPLATRRTYELVPSNQVVQSIAVRCGWRPETVVRRVSSALPAPIEQHLYLRIAESIRLHPESLAIILREFLGGRTLDYRDTQNVSVGENLSVNAFEEAVEFIGEVLSVSHDLVDLVGPTTIRNAVRLTKAYGPDNIHVIADSILRFVDATFRDSHSRERKTALVTYWLCAYGIPLCDDMGTPYPLDLEEWLRACPTARIRLLQYANAVGARQ